MLPTAWLAENRDEVWVTVGCLDDLGRAEPFLLKFSSKYPYELLNASSAPLITRGHTGLFDDNGVLITSRVPLKGGFSRFYYVGFEKFESIPYKLFTGFFDYDENTEKVVKRTLIPVLDRSPTESMFRCGAYVELIEDKFCMWYIAGSDWTTLEGKKVPIYQMKYMESDDGENWPGEGLEIMSPNEGEHGLGRPWVMTNSSGTSRIFFSVRKKTPPSYRIGYASGHPKEGYIRNDSNFDLDLNLLSFEETDLCYTSLVQLDDRVLCFYNGNGLGRDGLLLAEILNEQL